VSKNKENEPSVTVEILFTESFVNRNNESKACFVTSVDDISSTDKEFQIKDRLAEDRLGWIVA